MHATMLIAKMKMKEFVVMAIRDSTFHARMLIEMVFNMQKTIATH